MRYRMFLKLFVLGGLSILLLIALLSIGGVTHERKQRFLDVQRNIADSYAGEQRIMGPVFTIEYIERWTGRYRNDEKDNWYEKEMAAHRTATLFPQRLSYDGSLQVQARYRGIYKANVYQSRGFIEGTVELPLAETLAKEQSSTIEVVSAGACLFIADPRGISSAPLFKWDGEELNVEPGSGLRANSKGVHVPLADAEHLLGRSHAFTMELNIHGMGVFELVPVASDNTVRLASDWPHPSFIGDFLAVDRSVDEAGFRAEWQVNELACSVQQEMGAGKFGQLQYFGVSLVDPINPYPLTNRALKYGFLFVFITFAAFFLFELVKDLRIHPIQYGFVGLAQALFFLLLLSLSEHIGFGLSYTVAAFSTVAVITLYLCSVLHGFRRGLLFGAILSLLYGVLYALLQSEDHALLAGSALLFGLTAMVMMLTRKCDWYALTDRQDKD